MSYLTFPCSHIKIKKTMGLCALGGEGVLDERGVFKVQ